jgi:hypothetical protein
VLSPWIYLSVRPRPGYWEHLRINVDETWRTRNVLLIRIGAFPVHLMLFLDVDPGSTFCRICSCVLIEVRILDNLRF